MNNLSQFYNNKKVFVTGHTGFKGSWLCSWLLKLGAEVIGFSKDIPTNPSIFNMARLNDHIQTIEGDILDIELLTKSVSDSRPDIIFHAAAQPITTLAFSDPVGTFRTNVMGTVSVLEAMRKLNKPCSLVSLTSDKSYHNKEWMWGYRETDEIGGKDPYSASKSGAEMALRSYYHTYFKDSEHHRLAVVRSGNVIGGGDWGLNRIVPDCIRAWKDQKAVVIRSPRSIRPWQHVLEPLHGYLLLAENLNTDSTLNGEAFNFGPSATDHASVLELVSILGDYMKNLGVEARIENIEENDKREAATLKLNCEKAMTMLDWRPRLSLKENLRMTADWYYQGYWQQADMFQFCQNQIGAFESKL
jgi:CDP-glucose 4,6-dehydratase